MGRKPCCSKEEGLNRGAWTAIEDQVLIAYIKAHGEGKWRSIPKEAGLKRCGKSCRLRWLNYLRPDIKGGNITVDEEDLILRLHKLLGNRWSLIAGRLPGRTDNEIKNYWNTVLSKRGKGQFVVKGKERGRFNHHNHNHKHKHASNIGIINIKQENKKQIRVIAPKARRCSSSRVRVFTTPQPQPQPQPEAELAEATAILQQQQQTVVVVGKDSINGVRTAAAAVAGLELSESSSIDDEGSLALMSSLSNSKELQNPFPLDLDTIDSASDFSLQLMNDLETKCGINSTMVCDYNDWGEGLHGEEDCFQAYNLDSDFGFLSAFLDSN